jgi:hypothetical protein
MNLFLCAALVFHSVLVKIFWLMQIDCWSVGAYYVIFMFTSDKFMCLRRICFLRYIEV